MKRLLLVTCALLLLAGCGDEAASKKFDVSLYVGTYVGTWTNSATGATGAARIEIAADTAARTASLTIDFDGNYLGLDNPPAMALSGVYDDDKATVKGQSELFGAYDVTIDADGKIVGVMKGLAGGLIPEMTYTGALTRDRLDADYTVKFADGRVVNSILRMEK
jgi:hypothetical protein